MWRRVGRGRPFGLGGAPGADGPVLGGQAERATEAGDAAAPDRDTVNFAQLLGGVAAVIEADVHRLQARADVLISRHQRRRVLIATSGASPGGAVVMDGRARSRSHTRPPKTLRIRNWENTITEMPTASSFETPRLAKRR